MKKWISFVLCVTLLVGVAATALADVASLENALSRWIGNTTAVRFSTSLQMDTMMPFDDKTLEKMNTLLAHLQIKGSYEQDADASVTALQLSVDDTAVFDMTERIEGEQAVAQTALLPNRTLTSENGSVFAALNAKPVEAAEPVEGVSTADIGEAFSFVDAISELQACYTALTDGIAPYATEKSANYNIKSIGAGKWVRLAKLTEEQSASLLPELRAVLSCGMDAAYREELSQVVFPKTLTVALYRNKSDQDICVYIKGTMAYPDGTSYNLVFQWSFATDGLKRTDIYKYETSKASGKPSNSRTIAATCKSESMSDQYSYDDTAETTLKRSKITEKSTAKLKLAGKTAEDGTITCAGAVSQEIAHTEGGDTVKTKQAADVDLLLTPDDTSAVLSGTVQYSETTDKKVTFAATATLADTADFSTDAQVQSLYSVADDAVLKTDESAPASSLELIDDQPQTAANEYVIGTPPIGLKAYSAPTEATAVSVDNAAAVQELTAEMSQNLAGKLLKALGALPSEELAFLADGMTDADFSAFLNLLH